MLIFKRKTWRPLQKWSLKHGDQDLYKIKVKWWGPLDIHWGTLIRWRAQSSFGSFILVGGDIQKVKLERWILKCHFGPNLVFAKEVEVRGTIPLGLGIIYWGLVCLYAPLSNHIQPSLNFKKLTFSAPLDPLLSPSSFPPKPACLNEHFRLQGSSFSNSMIWASRLE